MIKEAAATTIRQNLGKLLNGIQCHHDQVVITEDGKPVAAIVDMPLFEKFQLLQGEFEWLSAELANTYKNVDAATVDAEIAEAMAAIRKH